MNKVLSAMLVVMAACLLFLGWHIDQQNKEMGALAEQNKTLTEAAERAVERQKSDRKVLVAREAKIAAKQRELARAQEALQNALEANKSWSDTDVPDEVQKALGGHSGGLPARL